MTFNNKHQKARRKELRNNGTTAEAVLWKYLRNSQLSGLKFRRQHGIGPYIVDFYCSSAKLAIELDGEVHRNDVAQEYDRRRTHYLISLGIDLVRFENQLVMRDLNYILKTINCRAQVTKIK